MIDQKTKDWILKDLQMILENNPDNYLLWDNVGRLIEDIESIPVITQISVSGCGTSEKMIKGLFWI